MYRQRRKLKRQVKIAILVMVLAVATFIFITVASAFENAVSQGEPQIEYGGVHKIPVFSYTFEEE